MKRFAFGVIGLLLIATPVFAEDSMNAVFDQIDDLIIRVESGISVTLRR